MCATRTNNVTLSERMFLRNSNFLSWLTAWPSSRFASLTDGEYMTALRIRFDDLPPLNILCPYHPTSLQSLTRAEYTRHMFSCKSCAAKHNIQRHERVVRILHRVLTHHMIHSKILRSGEVPLLGNDKGGSDLLVTTTKLWHVDVKVTSEALPYETATRLTQRYTATIDWYKNFESVTTWKTLPFVM